MSNLSPKVVASTLAAAIVTVLVWAAGAVGVEVPTEVQGAIITILVFLAGYVKVDPDRV